MPIVTVSGWVPGLRKISLTKLLQLSGGKDLGEAKAMVDALLEGRPFEINFHDEDAARTFADQARTLGAQAATGSQERP